MARALRIGIDLDGVCYEWQRTVMYMLRAYRGYSREQLSDVYKWTGWDWLKTQIGEEDEKWIWTEGIEKGLFRYGHLYPGTIKALNELAKIGELVILTHRPRAAIQDTLDWLAFNKLPVAEVHVLFHQEAKSSIMPACDIYLDDALHNVKDFERNTNGIALLWTRPWNMVTDEPFQRVTSWEQVIEKAKVMREAGHKRGE